MDQYCEKCGTKMIDGICPKCTETDTASRQKGTDHYTKFFMSPQEKLVTVLGNSYLQNFLANGSERKGYGIVSDKRLYYHGKSYDVHENKKGKQRLIKTKKARVIDLQDITGVGADSFSNISWLFWIACVVIFFIVLHKNVDTYEMEAVIAAEIWIGLPLILLFAFLYYRDRVTGIVIQYAGGKIVIDQKWYTADEISSFQQLTMLAKDRLQEEKTKMLAASLGNTMANMGGTDGNRQNVSKADELLKLSELLEKGILTKEEFEKAKKEVL